MIDCTHKKKSKPGKSINNPLILHGMAEPTETCFRKKSRRELGLRDRIIRDALAVDFASIYWRLSNKPPLPTAFLDVVPSVCSDLRILMYHISDAGWWNRVEYVMAVTCLREEAASIIAHVLRNSRENKLDWHRSGSIHKDDFPRSVPSIECSTVASDDKHRHLITSGANHVLTSGNFEIVATGDQVE